MFVFTVWLVRSGHSGVPFAQEIPALEFLVKSAALNAQAFGRQRGTPTGVHPWS